MDVKEEKICLFVHFSTSDTLPYYVQIYINELSRHFDKVKLLTNNSKIQEHKSLFNSNVSFEYLKNQGYDFGMVYRYIVKKNLKNFSEIAIINDSNILFNKLDHIFEWGRKSKADFWGIINSNEKPWFSKHSDNYHIQSHFVVLNKRAITKLPAFLKSIDIETILTEKDPKQLRRMVINNWEIGLTQFFLANGLIADSFIVYKNFENLATKGKNLTHSHYHELAGEGYSLLKKKVAIKKYKWFQPENKQWKQTLLKYGNHDWDMAKIINEMR